MRRNAFFVAAAFFAVLVSAELSLSLPILNIGPDLVIIVVATYAIGERPRTAAVAGFAVGLFRDLLLITPTGLSAFAYSLTAYAAASIGASRSAWSLIGLMAGATFASQLIFGLGAVMLGPEVDATPLPRMVIIATAYNALLSPLLLPLLRRVIRTDEMVQRGGMRVIRSGES